MYVCIYIYIYIFIFLIISLDVSCELSAKQPIHMKYLELFSLKNNNTKIIKMLSTTKFAWCIKG